MPHLVALEARDILAEPAWEAFRTGSSGARLEHARGMPADESRIRRRR